MNVKKSTDIYVEQDVRKRGKQYQTLGETYDALIKCRNDMAASPGFIPIELI